MAARMMQNIAKSSPQNSVSPARKGDNGMERPVVVPAKFKHAFQIRRDFKSCLSLCSILGVAS